LRKIPEISYMARSSFETRSGHRIYEISGILRKLTLQFLLFILRTYCVITIRTAVE